MAKRTCNVPICDRPVFAYGHCQGHHVRLKRTGSLSPEVPLQPRRPRGTAPGCKVEGCDRTGHKSVSLGYCDRHYWRFKQNGDPGPAGVVHHLGRDRTEAFWDKVDTSGDCWIWNGAVNADGYGSASSDYPASGAHRVAWIWENGPIEPGMELDHLCHTADTTCVGKVCLHRRCVNPSHMEAVTHHENVRRGNLFRFARG